MRDSPGHVAEHFARRDRHAIQAPMSAFRVAAMVEATTYLVLLTAVAVARILDGPDLVRPVGWVHGIAFLVYAGAAIAVARRRRWSARRTARILTAAVVPLGGYAVARADDP